MYRIAIVDDNETWCFVLALRLQQHGYAVSTFTDAQAFLREVSRFDLVLIDFSMPAPRHQPSIDGPELICLIQRQLRKPPRLVLISSYFTEDLLRNAIDICPEADAVLSKQVDTSEIFSTIQRLLGSQKPSEKRREAATSLNRY